MKSKRKLLIVVGAGSSVDFKMPSVSGVDKLLREVALQNCPLADDPSRSLYDHVHKTVSDFWIANDPGGKRGSGPNFEGILYALYALAGTEIAGVLTSALPALVDPKPLPDIMHLGRRSSVAGSVLNEVTSDLVDHIVKTFREKCSHADTHPAPEVAEFRGFLLALQEEFKIAVISLNYDNLIYRALPDLDTGFDIGGSGIFDQGRIFSSLSWSKLMHMHGSVHFDYISHRRDLHEIVWREDLASMFRSAQFGRTSSPEGVEFPTSTIIAGLGKPAQLLRTPFRTYYSALDRMVFESDALLIMGYGFGDHHLNQPFEKYRDSRNRPVVLIDYASDNTLTAGSGGDEVLSAAFRALGWFDTPPCSMSWLGYSFPNNVTRLKAEKEFELSTDPKRPLAIWYGGMLDACRNADKIVRELRAPSVIS